MARASYLALTYSRTVIWIVVIAILGLGTAAAGVVALVVTPTATIPSQSSRLLQAPAGSSTASEQALVDQLKRLADEPEGLLRFALDMQEGGSTTERLVAITHWPHGGGGERGAIDLVGPLLLQTEGVTPAAKLLELAAAQPPQRWVNRALGDLAFGYDRHAEALTHYQLEGGAFASAEFSRSRAWRLAVTFDRQDLLDVWQDDPLWAQSFGARERVERAAEQGDLIGIAKWVVPSMYEDMDWAMTVIAAVAGAVWVFFLFHASFDSDRRRELLAMCVAGFALGIVSTWLTIFLIYVEEHYDYGEGETLLSQAIYCFRGIALREEFAKLVCFLPLVPWVVTRGGPLAWLLVPSCVGAGFAAEENINYFRSTLGSALSGRFLTANFLHLALTGLVGQALCQAIRWPRTHLATFAGMLLIVIAVHGFYNLFFIIPTLQDYSIASYIIFILLGNYYFAVLHQNRPDRRPSLSLTMTFCAGLALCLAVAYAILTARFGMSGATDVLVPGTIASAILVIMFVRGINDGLSE